MPISKQKTLFLIVLLMANGSAYAQQQIGVTSGPAAGSVVIPSTVIQKMPSDMQQGRSVDVELRTSPGAAGGLPGVEALPGTEGGRVPADVEEDED